MATNPTSFQDRLKKIENKQAAGPDPAAVAAAAAAQAKPEPEFGARPKAESPIGNGTLMIAGGVVALLALGAVLARDVFAAPEDITAAVMADGAEREVSLLGRLVGGTFDPQSVQAQLPVYHLPAAPDGYVRATRADVRKMNALAQLRDQWPDGSGPGFVNMDQNPGFPALSKFVATSQVKSKKVEEEAKFRALAHYLGADGSHLQVTIRFLGEDNRLGADNAQTAWAERMFGSGLGFGTTRKLRMGDFDGRKIVGRGNVALDPESTTAMPVNIAVPLTPHVFLRITGKAPPIDIANMIRDVNVTGLLAFTG